MIPGLALLLYAACPVMFSQASVGLSLAVTAAFAWLAVCDWRRERTDAHLEGALATLGLLAATSLHAGYGSLERRSLSAARHWLAAGLVCFAIGLAISLAKAGAIRAAWSALFEWNRRFSAIDKGRASS